jgi:predicted DNA-binding transcriptional regulator AlpA
MQQRVYRFRDLRSAGCPFTRKHVTHLERHGQFPKHFNITDFSVGWVAVEVDAWVESKIRSRGAAPATQPTPKHGNGNGEASLTLEDKLRSRSIDELALSMRARNALHVAGIDYVGELVTKSEADVLRVPNIGRQCLAEIKSALKSVKLRLAR